MKTSQKILVVLAGMSLILLVTFLLVIRKDLQLFQIKTELANNYKVIPVDNFNALDFSSHWDVKIWQGRAYKVELAIDEASMLTPKLKNIDGTLYFDVDSTDNKGKITSLRAKITTPFLHAIKAAKGAMISLNDFKSDSIKVVLEDGAVFKGEENQFEYTSFKTSGDVSIQIIDDPYK